MRVPAYRAKWPEYARQWDAMRIRPARARAVKATARRLHAAKARYQAIERASGVPWAMVAVLHERESGHDDNSASEPHQCAEESRHHGQAHRREVPHEHSWRGRIGIQFLTTSAWGADASSPWSNFS